MVFVPPRIISVSAAIDNSYTPYIFSEFELALIFILCVIILILICLIFDKLTSKISKNKQEKEKLKRMKYFDDMENAITNYFDGLHR